MADVIIDARGDKAVIVPGGLDQLAPLIAQAAASADASAASASAAAASEEAAAEHVAEAAAALGSAINQQYLDRLAFPRRNLFDPGKAVYGTLVRADGTLAVLGGTTYYATGPMSVVPGGKIVASGKTDLNNDGEYGWHFLNRSEEVVESIAGAQAGELVDVPNDPTIFYAIASFNTEATPAASLRIYSETLTNPDVVSPADLARYAYDVNPGRSLIDWSAVVYGSVQNVSGDVEALGNDTFAWSGKFPVKPGSTIASSHNTNIGGSGTYGWAFWGIEGNLVGTAIGTAADVGVAVPASAYFASASIDIGEGGGYWAIYEADHPAGSLSGKLWMPDGDSITANHLGIYQHWVTTHTGLRIPYTQARGGRRMDQVFEFFQTGTPDFRGNPETGLFNGGTLAPDNPAYVPGGYDNFPGPFPETGLTLAEILEPIDVVTLAYGTNDGPYFKDLLNNIGTIGDLPSGSSYYANCRRVVEGYLNAKPSLKLIWTIPHMNAGSGFPRYDPSIGFVRDTTIADVQRIICREYALPCLDLMAESGINLISRSEYLVEVDQLHLTALGAREIYGRRIAAKMHEVFGL